MDDDQLGPAKGMLLGALVGLVVWVLVIVLLLATPAGAAYGPPATDPLALRSVQVAREYWGAGLPCLEVAYADLSTAGVDYLGRPTRLLAGGAPCLILLNQGTWGRPWVRNGIDRERMRPWRWCQLVVHEYGHALGHTHANEEPPIMQEWFFRGLIPGCMTLRLRSATPIKGRLL